MSKIEKETRKVSFERKVKTKFTHLLKFVSAHHESDILRLKTSLCNNVYKVNKGCILLHLLLSFKM